MRDPGSVAEAESRGRSRAPSDTVVPVAAPVATPATPASVEVPVAEMPRAELNGDAPAVVFGAAHSTAETNAVANAASGLPAVAEERPAERAESRGDRPATFAAAAEPLAVTGLKRTSRGRWVAIGITGLLLVVGLLVYEMLRGGFGQVVLRPGDTVLLAPIENKTGEADLDRSVMQGLEIELAESSKVRFEGLSAFRAGGAAAWGGDA